MTKKPSEPSSAKLTANYLPFELLSADVPINTKVATHWENLCYSITRLPESDHAKVWKLISDRALRNLENALKERLRRSSQGEPG